MAIEPLTKTFAPQMANIIRRLCHYTTKYQQQINVIIEAVITDPTDKAALKSFISAIVGACGIVNKYWPVEQG